MLASRNSARRERSEHLCVICANLCPSPTGEIGNTHTDNTYFRQGLNSYFKIYKNTKSKTGFWGLTPYTDLVFENNLDADIFWNLNPHKLSECALICVKVD